MQLLPVKIFCSVFWLVNGDLRQDLLRFANTVHRGLGHSVFLSQVYLFYSLSKLCQQLLLLLVSEFRLSSKLYTTFLCFCHSFVTTFVDKIALELSNSSEQMKCQSSCRSGGINLLVKNYKVNVLAFQNRDNLL